MDLLYQRYASPFSFIQNALDVGRLSKFVDDFIINISKEENERKLWEFYLHRQIEVSFNEFKETVEQQEQTRRQEERTRQMSNKQIETTLQNTINMVNEFNLRKGGET